LDIEITVKYGTLYLPLKKQCYHLIITDNNCTQNSNSSLLLIDAELGFSSIPLSTGQTGSSTAIKLTTTVVQDINLNN
jgi:hypothetical protein